MNRITLENNGDNVEKFYYHRFIAKEFPSYETFWLNFIVPTTNRPDDINFKSDQELKSMGRGDHDICISQLHYSVLRHLVRAFDIKSQSQNPLTLDGLTEGMVRLVGTQDIAFELLERCRTGQYDPWLSVESRKARKTWQNNHHYPLQEIRNYRNHLVHGRLLPGVICGDVFVPKIGIEENYFDWRLITNNPNIEQLIGGELISTREVLENAWNQTVRYLEINWRENLI